MKLISLSLYAFQKFCTQYRSASHGDKQEVLVRWAERAGCHPNSLRNAFYRGHITRPKEYRFAPDKEPVLKRAAAYMEARMFSNQATRMPLTYVIEEAEAFDVIPKGAIKPRELGAYLRYYRLGSQHRISGKFARDHSNSLHQIDFSVSTVLAAAGEGSVQVRSKFKIPYVNRPDDPRERAWIGTVVDDASGVLFAQYFLSPGESTEVAIDLMEAAWRRKPDYPFWGVPEALYSDRVGWGKTDKVKHLLGKLETRHVKPEEAETPWVKGKVERPFGIIKEKFEKHTLGALARGTILSLERVNEMLRKFCMEWNTGNHRSGKCSRISYWRNHVGELWFPANFRDLAFKQIRAVVRRGTIQYDTRSYYSPPGIPNGERVELIELEGELYIYQPETKFRPAQRLLLEEAEFNVAPPVDAKAEVIKEEVSQIRIPHASLDKVDEVLSSRIKGIDLTPPPPTRHDEPQGPGVELLHEDAQRGLLADILGRPLGGLPPELREELIDPFCVAPHSRKAVKAQAERIKEVLERPARSEIEERMRSDHE